MRSFRSAQTYRTARDRVARRNSSAHAIRPRKHRSSGCGLIMLGLLIATILSGVVGLFILNRFNQATEKIIQQDPRLLKQQQHNQPDSAQHSQHVPIVTPDTLREAFNVLLIGVDKRENPEEGARSDTLIVVRVNPVNHTIGMLSIPRDSMAQIPNVGMQKINYAYTYGYMYSEDLYGSRTSPDSGGGALAAETIEKFLGVRIDYIAQVDFQGFERMVDMLGGVTVDVQKPILDAEYPTENFGYERIYIPAGLQTMDGHTALRYARSRHSSTDFDRSRRQQQVLRAVFKGLQERGILDQLDMLPGLIENLQQSVQTTMPIGDPSTLYGLAKIAQEIKPESIQQLSINPNDVAVIQELGSDIYWDQEGVTQLVRRFLNGTTQKSGEKQVAQVQVLNGTGINGLAAKVTSVLNKEGFTTIEAADAPQAYANTMIVDYTGFPEIRDHLARLLSIDSKYVFATPPANAMNLSVNSDIVLILGKDYQATN